MIRPYKPEDIKTITEIANRAWQPIYKMYREALGEELFDILFPDPDNEKGNQIKNHCSKHPEWVFICSENDQIAGFITFWLDEEKKIGNIGNNAVDPNWRLKGIGQQMYKAVFEYFRRQGMAYANVRTGLDYAHTPARKAYEKAGFNINHKDIDYYMKL
jgi:ribosomal protein S18 acetylase RimI-like enzyme